jgi:hypothetical protein
MIVKPEAGKAIEIAAQRDADHVRRNPVDAPDFQLAPTWLVPDPARRTCWIRF